MQTRRHRSSALVTLVAAAALILGACGSGEDASPADTEVKLTEEAATIDAPTTTVADTTTTTETTTDTTAPIATTGTENPEVSALTLYDAWYADDRVTAATVAEPEAVEGMWKTARGDYSLYSGCDSAEFDTSGCLFRGANGTIQFTMERRGDAWVVIEAFYSEP